MEKITTTIVSAYISDVNQLRDPSFYIPRAKVLLNSPYPKVIFIEKKIYDQFLKEEKFPQTHFILTKGKEDLLFYKNLSDLTEFKVVTENPKKDTKEYMITQCNKNEWVKQAIKANPFQTDQFVWIDIGLFYIINNEKGYQEALKKMMTRSYKKVRIPKGWDLKDKKSSDFLDSEVCWYFLGGVFGGNQKSLLEFAEKMEEECKKIIQRKKMIWEVNLWFLIYCGCPELFDPYQASFDLSIMDKY